MPIYRIYALDSTDHIFRPPIVLECDDDQAAIEEAKQLLNGAAIEVWEQKRRVVRLEPHPPEAK